jgi:hypothetical protein
LSETPLDLSGYPAVSAHQHWVDCIRAGIQPPLCNASYARHVTEIMLRGLESARSGRNVAVDSRLPALREAAWSTGVHRESWTSELT